VTIPNYNLVELHMRLEQLERVVKELATMERDLLSPQTAKWLDGIHPDPNIQVPKVKQTPSGCIEGVPKQRPKAVELDPLLVKAMQGFDKIFERDAPHEPTMQEIIKMERGE
jgi:hypothetical protein